MEAAPSDWLQLPATVKLHHATTRPSLGRSPCGFLVKCAICAQISQSIECDKFHAVLSEMHGVERLQIFDVLNAWPKRFFLALLCGQHVRAARTARTGQLRSDNYLAQDLPQFYSDHNAVSKQDAIRSFIDRIQLSATDSKKNSPFCGMCKGAGNLVWSWRCGICSQ